MRELTFFENNVVAGGDITCRDDLREAVVDVSLIFAPMWGSEIGMAYAAGTGLSYSLMAGLAGGFAAIVAVPVVAKVGLELMFGMHDLLV